MLEILVSLGKEIGHSEALQLQINLHGQLRTMLSLPVMVFMATMSRSQHEKWKFEIRLEIGDWSHSKFGQNLKNAN